MYIYINENHMRHLKNYPHLENFVDEDNLMDGRAYN